MKEDVEDCGGGKRIIRFIGNPKEWMAEFSNNGRPSKYELKDGRVCGDNILTFYRSKLLNKFNRLVAKNKKSAFKALSFVGFLPPLGTKLALFQYKMTDEGEIRFFSKIRKPYLEKYYWHENEYDCGYFSYHGIRLDIKRMVWWEIYHHDAVAGKWAYMPFWVKSAVNFFHRVNTKL